VYNVFFIAINECVYAVNFIAINECVYAVNYIPVTNISWLYVVFVNEKREHVLGYKDHSMASSELNL
jgi:hypothetical protein